MDFGAVVGTVVGTVLASTVVASAVSGLITWRIQTNSLQQQRFMETTKLFATLAALGNARDPEGKRDSVGLSEQLAAVSSVAAIGKAYEPLRAAAVSYMEGHVSTYSTANPTPASSVVEVAQAELDRLKALK